MFTKEKQERRATQLTDFKSGGFISNNMIANTNLGLYEALCNINENLSRIADALEGRTREWVLSLFYRFTPDSALYDADVKCASLPDSQFHGVIYP